MMTTGNSPVCPKIMRPEWPRTVDAFAPGISPYGIAVSTSTASTTSPRPEPRIKPMRGCSAVRERTNATASSIFWIMAAQYKLRKSRFNDWGGPLHGAFLRADWLCRHPRHRVFAVEQQAVHPLAHGVLGPAA